MNLFINFLTAVSVIYSVGYIVSLLVVFYQFSQLSVRAQNRTKINLPMSALILFVFSVGFLIAVYMT